MSKKKFNGNNNTAPFTYPEMWCFTEFRQKLWEDIAELDRVGVEWVKDGKLYLPVVDIHGDPLDVRRLGDGSIRTGGRAYVDAQMQYRFN